MSISSSLIGTMRFLRSRVLQEVARVVRLVVLTAIGAVALGGILGCKKLLHASLEIRTPDGHHYCLTSDPRGLMRLRPGVDTKLHNLLLSKSEMAAVLEILMNRHVLEEEEAGCEPAVQSVAKLKTPAVRVLLNPDLEHGRTRFYHLGTPARAERILQEISDQLPENLRGDLQKSMNALRNGRSSA